MQDSVCRYEKNTIFKDSVSKYNNWPKSYWIHNTHERADLNPQTLFKPYQLSQNIVYKYIPFYKDCVNAWSLFQIHLQIWPQRHMIMYAFGYPPVSAYKCPLPWFSRKTSFLYAWHPFRVLSTKNQE